MLTLLEIKPRLAVLKTTKHRMKGFSVSLAEYEILGKNPIVSSFKKRPKPKP